MNKRYRPFAVFESLYAIPFSFYKENGITIVLSDLDNTLDSFKMKEPSPKAQALAAAFKKEGIALYIVSNNTSARVRRYSEKLGVKAYSGLWKPSGRRLRRLLAAEGFAPAQTALVGDQILTDVAAGNRAKIRVILTKPLTPFDQPWTKINRLLEKRLRRKILASFAAGKEAQ
jgi:HAD superfamily phosphatase (TIGR01668 family)